MHARTPRTRQTTQRESRKARCKKHADSLQREAKASKEIRESTSGGDGRGPQGSSLFFSLSPISSSSSHSFRFSLHVVRGDSCLAGWLAIAPTVYTVGANRTWQREGVARRPACGSDSVSPEQPSHVYPVKVPLTVEINVRQHAT